MDQDIRIYAKGLAFSDGIYDLRALESVISNYRKLLDRLVSVQLGKRQVTRDLRTQLGILGNVDGKAVEYIDIASPKSELRFTTDDRDIIGQHKEELLTTLTIIGRLDMVAFSSHRGSVISDNERFSVTWDENIRPKMQKVADVEGVMFKVRPVVDHKRLDTSAIGFHVLDCGDPQSKMFG